MKYRVTLTAAVCSLLSAGTLTLSSTAAAAQWGVIASTYDTLRETHVISETSLNDALFEAVQTCRKQTPGQDCFAVATVQDGCLTWAVDRRGHWGWAQTPGARPGSEGLLAMERKALDQCNQDPDAGRCRVVRTICTDDRES